MTRADIQAVQSVSTNLVQTGAGTAGDIASPTGDQATRLIVSCTCSSTFWSVANGNRDTSTCQLHSDYPFSLWRPFSTVSLDRSSTRLLDSLWYSPVSFSLFDSFVST